MPYSIQHFNIFYFTIQAAISASKFSFPGFDYIFLIFSFFFLSIFDTLHSHFHFIVLTVVRKYIENSNLHITGAAGAVSVLTGFD